MPRKQRGRFRRWFVATLIGSMFSAALVVLLMFVWMHDIQRFVMIGRLCSADDKHQRQAVSYLVHHVEDPVVLAGADEALAVAGGECFERVVDDLARADSWGPRFERSWVRYLTGRAEQVDTLQRTYIAVELGKLVWHRKPHHDDPRIAVAVRKLLKDPEPSVRLNALSAAACLAEPHRSELIAVAMDDPHPQILWHASLLRGLIEGLIETPDESTPPAGLEPQLRALYDLEQEPTASRPLEIQSDWPLMRRLAAVRVSSTSVPGDLLPVFESENAAMRDLACVVALERFSPAQCRELAGELIGSFSDEHRRAGAMLAGMAPGAKQDHELMDRVRYRASRGDDWLLKQHYLLSLWMIAEPVESFNPQGLMMHKQFPKTTLIMAMLHAGRLEGTDWLLNPFGEPPEGGTEGLRSLLSYHRYAFVLNRFLPRMPGFPVWADEKVQKQELDLVRDWYLVFRPQLRFDPTQHRFLTDTQPRPANP